MKLAWIFGIAFGAIVALGLTGKIPVPSMIGAELVIVFGSYLVPEAWL